MKTPEEMAASCARTEDTARGIWNRMAQDFAAFAGRPDSVELAERYKVALASLIGTIPPAP